MRFESVLIQNYRQYDSCQLDFPKSKNTDLHIVIASNGVGKTNLLNAIEWCLYETESHLGDDSSSLPICNMTALEKGQENGEDRETVLVQLDASTEQGSLRFIRTTKVKTTPPYFEDKPSFKVIETIIGKSAQIYEGESAKDIVNQYLPQNIKEYFFFDGEQLFNYFGKSNSNIHVKNSIHEVAQISVVTSAKEHLETIIKDYRDEIGKSNPKTKEINDEIKLLEASKEALQEDNALLEEQIQKAQELINEFNIKINGSERAVEDRDRYESNREELERLDKEYEEKANDLNALVRQYYPALMMYSINNSTRQFIQDKQERGKLPPEVDVELIRRSLSTHKCAVCGRDTDEDAEAHLDALLRQLEVSIGTSHLLVGISSDVTRLCELAKQYDAYKQSIYTAMNGIRSRKNALEMENDEIGKKLFGSEYTAQIATWIQDREIQQNLLTANAKKVGANDVEIQNIVEKRNTLQKKLDAARKADDKVKNLNRCLDFATDAKAIVSEIESEIIDEVRKRMEKETMTLFDDLIWKKDTYGRISLADDYQLELFTKYTDQSCLGSCSAAERELLALAFTIALHKVSGHDAPLFIDTPVGRVSDANRENFARNLIAVSQEKQIILSFTPSEFSKEISKYFDDSVLSSKRWLSLVTEKTVEVN